MTLIEIRQELERLLAPDAEHLQQLATAWENIRWTFPEVPSDGRKRGTKCHTTANELESGKCRFRMFWGNSLVTLVTISVTTLYQCLQGDQSLRIWSGQLWSLWSFLTRVDQSDQSKKNGLVAL